MVADTNFRTFQFLFENSSFIIGNNLVVFFEETELVEKQCLPTNLSLNNHGLSLILSRKNCIPQKSS
jgi:hypothetical protein